jgi:uncharacterized protein (DUF1800 family)
VKFILKSKAPLQAKLALFWHDHFSVGFAKVQDTYHMARYVRDAASLREGQLQGLREDDECTAR